jgi:N6-L-threonylcarbamoyladenine synthase
LGEAFDKVAKMLDLGYPGGPPIERRAASGDPRRFPLPRPMKGRPDCHFSFSGLKTAVRHAIARWPSIDRSETDVADLCASFQAAVGDVLVDRTQRAVRVFAETHPGARTLVIAGGVAANGYLRLRLETLAASQGLRLVAPPLRLCSDNGAMIAWAGIERLRLGLVDPLDFAPRPRWPLDPLAPPAGLAPGKG